MEGPSGYLINLGVDLEDIVIKFNSREVLDDDARGSERNLGVVLRSLGPVEDCLNVVLLDGEVVAVTDSALKEDTDGVWQGGCNRETDEDQVC